MKHYDSPTADAALMMQLGCDGGVWQSFMLDNILFFVPGSFCGIRYLQSMFIALAGPLMLMKPLVP